MSSVSNKKGITFVGIKGTINGTERTVYSDATNQAIIRLFDELLRCARYLQQVQPHLKEINVIPMIDAPDGIHPRIRILCTKGPDAERMLTLQIDKEMTEIANRILNIGDSPLHPSYNPSTLPSLESAPQTAAEAIAKANQDVAQMTHELLAQQPPLQTANVNPPPRAPRLPAQANAPDLAVEAPQQRRPHPGPPGYPPPRLPPRQPAQVAQLRPQEDPPQLAPAPDRDHLNGLERRLGTEPEEQVREPRQGLFAGIARLGARLIGRGNEQPAQAPHQQLLIGANPNAGQEPAEHDGSDSEDDEIWYDALEEPVIAQRAIHSPKPLTVEREEAPAMEDVRPPLSPSQRKEISVIGFIDTMISKLDEYQTRIYNIVRDSSLTIRQKLDKLKTVEELIALIEPYFNGAEKGAFLNGNDRGLKKSTYISILQITIFLNRLRNKLLQTRQAPQRTGGAGPAFESDEEPQGWALRAARRRSQRAFNDRLERQDADRLEQLDAERLKEELETYLMNLRNDPEEARISARKESNLGEKADTDLSRTESEQLIHLSQIIINFNSAHYIVAHEELSIKLPADLKLIYMDRALGYIREAGCGLPRVLKKYDGILSNQQYAIRKLKITLLTERIEREIARIKAQIRKENEELLKTRQAPQRTGGAGPAFESDEEPQGWALRAARRRSQRALNDRLEQQDARRLEEQLDAYLMNLRDDTEEARRSARKESNLGEKAYTDLSRKESEQLSHLSQIIKNFNSAHYIVAHEELSIKFPANLKLTYMNRALEYIREAGCGLPHVLKKYDGILSNQQYAIRELKITQLTERIERQIARIKTQIRKENEE